MSEKSYAGIEQNTYTFLVDPRANKTEIKEAVQVDLGRHRDLGQHAEPTRQGRSAAGTPRASAPTRSARSSPSPKATPSRSSKAGRDSMAVRKYKPTTTGTPRRERLRPSTRSRARRRRSRSSPRDARRPGATCTAGSPRATRAAATSAATGSIDFRRNKDGVPAKVAHIEYDPNRSARIALLHYVDGEKRYILAPQGVMQGDTLMSGPDAEIRPGNALPLRNIPVGTVIHAIELKPGAGAKMARSAGTERPADGEGGQVRHAAAAVRRDAAGRRRRARERSAWWATPSTS